MKKKFINIILSLFTFVAILIYNNDFLNGNSYNILITLLFFVLYYFYSKIDVQGNKKIKMFSFVLSIILGIILSVGNIINKYIYDMPFNIFNLNRTIYSILMIIGFIPFFYKLFTLLIQKTPKILKLKNKQQMSKKEFIVIMSIIIFGNFLYFIRFFPAIMSPDSYYVIHYANNYILSDFHTFGHTWFFGIFFHLGKVLFNNLNTAVGFSIIIQMICISILFTIVIKYLYNKGISKKICLLISLIYGFTPLFGHYSVTLWRDVMFGTAFAPLFISLYEIVTNKKNNKGNLVLFTICILIIMFFRNNGIYIFIFTIPFLIIFLKDKRKIMSIICTTLLIFYFVIKGPIFNYFNVERSKTAEAYSIPLQQMARVVALDYKITGNDKKFLENLWEYNKVATSYRNITSDPIKTITNNDFLRNNKKDFIKTYLSLLMKHPKVYIEAYMMETIGYWYPDIIYWATGSESKGIFEEEKVYNIPLTPSWYNKIIDYTTSRSLPLSNILWSVGLSFIILLISSFITAFYNKKILLCYVPLFGLWLSIMAATPVFCELRYVYGLFTSLPLLILIPLITAYEKNNKGVKK